MISIKKGVSSPLLSRNSMSELPTKAKKQQMQDLESQVSKSRLAIENISQAKAVDAHLHKQIQELQRELHHCILAINQETSKNKALSDIVTILKGQMKEVQALQRNQKEYQSHTFEKKIKKVQYDIKQILHKYNEEIAKINHLKEYANVARDERVVYSNLFNKIEKEIKHYEEIYKRKLIKDQIFLQKKKQQQHPNRWPFQLRSQDHIEQTSQHFYQIDTNSNNSLVGTAKQISKVRDTRSFEVKKSMRIKQSDMFLTNIKQSKPSRTNLDNSRKGKNKSINQTLQEKIYEKQAEIDKIIMLSQCESLEDAIGYYTEVQNINDSLFEEIEVIENRISDAEQEIERLRQQKRFSQAYQNGQITQFLNISKNSRSNKHLLLDQGTPIDQSTEILLQVCKTLNIGSERQTLHFNQDVIQEIDTKINDLQCSHYQRKPNRKQSNSPTIEQIYFKPDQGVSQLLDRIDRFNQSQKIFDRAMLQMEYQRQIGRCGRKRGKRSN